ncbi:MAG: hypothetical protein DRP02_13865 [Candidatus Gerdarchaeota archaeon]|nr:MAG: hypothetical protein DRP02_13865 [Candidatus Gerdarchaeota archaeon]
MFENMSQSEKKSFIYTIIGFVIIFSIFFAIIIMFSMKAEQANFEVIEEGQYIKMDYDPRPFIDAQWTFSFIPLNKRLALANMKKKSILSSSTGNFISRACIIIALSLRNIM